MLLGAPAIDGTDGGKGAAIAANEAGRAGTVKIVALDRNDDMLLLSRFGPIERFPREVLRERHKLALLFKTLATLRTDERLFVDVEELRWRGPTEAFAGCVGRLGDERLLARSLKAATR
jgi:hypothetical protein